MIAQLRHLWSVLRGDVHIAPHTCDKPRGCGRTFTRITRRQYRRWETARFYHPYPRPDCLCGCPLQPVPADLRVTS